MKRRHTLAISLLLGLTVVAGAFAAVRTSGVIGGSEPAAATASDSGIAAREDALDRWQLELEQALAEKPPKLPAVPEVPVATAPAQQVVTVQAAPAAGGEDSRYEDDDDYEEGDDHGDDDHEEEDD